VWTKPLYIAIIFSSRVLFHIRLLSPSTTTGFSTSSISGFLPAPTIATGSEVAASDFRISFCTVERVLVWSIELKSAVKLSSAMHCISEGSHADPSAANARKHLRRSTPETMDSIE
jgi:hypothetical protein